MKLASFFPPKESFNRNKLYVAPSTKKKRLTLSIPHQVSTVIAGKERNGSADVSYNLEFCDEMVFGVGLSTESKHLIAVQSTDFIHHQIQQLKPRTSYAVEHVSSGKFDYRSMMFILGQAFIGGAAGVRFTYGNTPAGFRTLSTGWTVPSVGEATFGPNIAHTPNEFMTLLGLAGHAGIDNITFMTDTVPASEGRYLSGTSLSVLSFRVALNILQAASDCMCYGAHRLAFEAGKLSVATLHAHTDEGGWVRKMLTQPTYPKCCGIVSGTGRSFIGFPLQEDIDYMETLRLSVAGMLEVIALLPVADIQLNGKLSVYDKDPEGEGRPGDFGSFMYDIGTVLEKWRDLVCDLDSIHHDGVRDIGAYDRFYEHNSVNRHFKLDVIVPFFFVEFSPLLTSDYQSVFVPAAHDRVVDLPLFAATNVAHNSQVLGARGRCVKGSSTWVIRSATTFREEGASYIFSSVYCEKNGLNQLSNVADLEGAYEPRPLAFVDNGAESIAGMRWMTPHNPMPHPLEGTSSQPSTFKWDNVTGYMDPTPDDIMNGKVASFFGFFEVTSITKERATKTHRSIPAHLRKYVKLGNKNYEVFVGKKIFSVKETVTPSSPYIATLKEPNNETKPTTPLTSTPHELDDPQPKVIKAYPAEAGVSIKTPSVKTPNLEDDKSPGSAEPDPAKREV